MCIALKHPVRGQELRQQLPTRGSNDTHPADQTQIMAALNPLWRGQVETALMPPKTPASMPDEPTGKSDTPEAGQTEDKPKAYYNEWDPRTADWLRALIDDGLIPWGQVDERSVVDVAPSDLDGFTQCHFFAGIGGWPLALRMSNWPDDRPVWTGSAPCQPFSTVGKRKGKDDGRHLAPAWIELIKACRPQTVFGEQVASAEVVGRVAGRVGASHEETPVWSWFDDLSTRLERARYAVGALDLPAAGVGAPHIRQRLFFGAVRLPGAAVAGEDARLGIDRDRLGDPAGRRSQRRQVTGASSPPPGRRNKGKKRLARAAGNQSGLADGDSLGRDAAIPASRTDGSVLRQPVTSDAAEGMADDQGNRRGDPGGEDQRQSPEWPELGSAAGGTSPDHGFWRDADWLGCWDGTWRPVEPGTFPLADGIPARVGRLRGYGNAIVPQVAEAFIREFDATVKSVFGIDGDTQGKRSEDR